MDAKSLAKSKRAHSLHHSKKQHHHQKPKPVRPAAAAKHAPKQTVNQVLGTVYQKFKLRNALPSNWDRYDDEDDLDSRNYAHDKYVKTRNVPKSKGADYTYLISEARSQLSPANLPSLDDDIIDIYQGLGPLLSLRGECILSWVNDDNFDVDDDNSNANVEASFLSLDFNALSDRLEEMDLYERLFIDSDDILSEELSAQVSEPNCSYRSEQVQHVEEVAEKSFVPEKENFVSRLEAELDILLNSFSETKFFDSTATPDYTKSYFDVENKINSTSYSKHTSITASLDDDLDDLLQETSNVLLEKSSNINLPWPKRGIWTSHIGGAMPTSVRLDDTLDDILNETSNLTNQSRWSTKPVCNDSFSMSILLDDNSFFDTL